METEECTTKDLGNKRASGVNKTNKQDFDIYVPGEKSVCVCQCVLRGVVYKARLFKYPIS